MNFRHAQSPRSMTPASNRRWTRRATASSPSAPSRSPRCPSSRPCASARADVKDHVLATTSTATSSATRQQVDAARRSGALGPRRAEEAREIILDICRNARTQDHHQGQVDGQRGDRPRTTRSKPPAIDVVETDLGEYIIQLAKEPPSHIIVPGRAQDARAGGRPVRRRPTARSATPST